ncbi:MAG: diguanylate cyclase [Acidobacteriia bacterium]|nr:diguanylate cyclase [Terriglobia bacterium]
MSELDKPEIFQSVLETLQTGVYLVDRNRCIRFWNEGAERITGYFRQDVVGRFLRDHLLTTPDQINSVGADPEDPINVVFRDGKSSVSDVSILHKDGFRVPVVLRTIPVRNSHGAVVGAAESFDKNQSASDWTRRQAGLADFGCLDDVTGVPTRKFMETQLRENLATFAEHNIPFGILAIQVDGMDEYRCRRGPGVVPTILRVVAQTVENCLRPTDLVGRWSEHLFLAVLIECKESELARVGERVRKIVGQSEIEWWGDTFSVTCAFGGAGSRVGESLEQLMERAQQSLQESIVRGGNCVTTRA